MCTYNTQVLLPPCGVTGTSFHGAPRRQRLTPTPVPHPCFSWALLLGTPILIPLWVDFSLSLTLHAPGAEASGWGDWVGWDGAAPGPLVETCILDAA